MIKYINRQIDKQIDKKKANKDSLFILLAARPYVTTCDPCHYSTTHCSPIKTTPPPDTVHILLVIEMLLGRQNVT